MKRRLLACSLLLIVPLTIFADGPRDNDPKRVRKVPRQGIKVPAAMRKKLVSGLRDLGSRIKKLQLSKNARVRELAPDVEIFHRAVSDALRFDEFFRPGEIKNALNLLHQGKGRADQLLANDFVGWTTKKGLVVRGFRSKLDRTVQPYGLIVPQSYSGKTGHKYRLDVWFHGRGETLSEVNFLSSRQRRRGTFAPADTIVLHPYGRYSNAFKFAGEIDVLEAIESVKKRYRIDPDRISVRGFSMGGAACWQFAVHYADRWFAANPGAGFSETPEFLRFFQKEKLNPTWYEKTLWRWYDCTDWAENLVHCPTVAYSGEKDIQKQAADIMESALKKHGVDLVHIIGKNMGHRYDRKSANEVDRRLASLARRGRQRVPMEIAFTTYTLRYNRMHWLTVDRLNEHWRKATVRGRIYTNGLTLEPNDNVNQMTFNFRAGEAPWSIRRGVQIRLNRQTIRGPRPLSDGSWTASVHKAGNRWVLGKPKGSGHAKRHGLQGPIDDAFMDSFLFVKPTGKSPNAKLTKWAAGELQHAITHWRQQFRGHARVKDDKDISKADIRDCNLVLWGDPASNSVMKQIVGKLPIKWSRDAIDVRSKKYDAANHALICIYPNPLNPKRYIVLNSCFTYREYAYLNNARQVPKLPDWAVVDLRVAPDTLWPGRIADANFFDENWEIK